MDLELRGVMKMARTEDARGAIAALAGKRQPLFHGR